MSISWWAEAAHASNYIYNCFPHHALGCTPFELWYGHKPNLANLRVWGCLAYVHLQKDQREKLKHGAHTRLCTFVAYRDDYKGWEFLNHETGSRVVSRDVLWQENAFRHKPWIPWPEEPPMLRPPAAQNAPAAPHPPADRPLPPSLTRMSWIRGEMTSLYLHLHLHLHLLPWCTHQIHLRLLQ